MRRRTWLMPQPLQRHASDGAVVLAYHDVVSDADQVRSPLTVTVDQLRTHLALIKSFGLQFTDLATLVEHHRTKRTLAGFAAVTFDDGLAGVLEHGLPVLLEENITATVFVVAADPGVPPSWWPGARRTLRSSELEELLAAGVAFGSHTMTHPSLPRLTVAEARHELNASRERLEAMSGRPVTTLAFPFGHHDHVIRRVAGEAGYSAAFTFLNGRITGSDDPFRLPRLTMGNHINRRRLAYHLLRSASSWPDHQLDTVTGGGCRRASISEQSARSLGRNRSIRRILLRTCPSIKSYVVESS